MAKKQKNSDPGQPEREPESVPAPDIELEDDADVDSELLLEHAHHQPAKKPASPSNPFYGCVILLIAVTTFSFIILWTIYSGLKQSAEIDGFTVLDAEPLAVPEVTGSQRTAIAMKLDTFALVAKNGKPVTLTLTLEELNAVLVLAGEKDVADYRGMVRFTSMDPSANVLKADIHWKMNNLPFVQAAERFLVGQATFKPVIENGTLELHIETLKVPGKLVSEGFMRQLRNWPWLNLAKLKPEVREPLAMVTRVEFTKDGTMLALHCGSTIPR